MDNVLRQKLVALLSQGKGYTLAEISAHFDYIDARSAIRNLRREGVIITARWSEADHRCRCKEFLIEGEKAESHVSPKLKERR